MQQLGFVEEWASLIMGCYLHSWFLGEGEWGAPPIVQTIEGHLARRPTIPLSFSPLRVGALLHAQEL